MRRGRLRIYLGAAPGVGKTVAMLAEGRRRADRGTDVVVAVVETHGRPFTAAALDGLEVVPRREVSHRGGTFTELDLDAVLARAPAVALVDELAHTNVPGSLHEKRWQDVDAMLDAGIDVISTVNIQHLESLNDVVERITGIRQAETVPDAVVRAAEQIELVDMAPEALRRRLAHGNVYAAEKVDAALANYFRVGNLTALRELALLWVADRVDEGLTRYREAHGIAETWAARDRIVVALTGGPEGEALLRRGALIAGRTAGRDLVAVHVVRSDGVRDVPADGLARLRSLTEDLGGAFHTVVGEDPATAILDFARSVNGTQVVVGATRRGRWGRLLSESTVDRVVAASGDIDVHVVTHDAAKVPTRTSRSRARPGWRWALAAAIPATLSVVMLPWRDNLSLTTVVLLFLVGVVTSGLVGGLRPAVTSAVVAGVLANLLFTPPFGTLVIAQAEDALALAVFVVVAAVIAVIVDRSAVLVDVAARRRAEADLLASLSAEVLRHEDAVTVLLDRVREAFGQQATALFERREAPARDPWHVIGSVGAQPPHDPDHADAVVEAGPGLLLAMRGRSLSADDRRVLQAIAAHVAAVVERTHLRERAAAASRLEQVDAVRTALLAAVSHDLRTPLAGIRAALDTLGAGELDLDEADRRHLLDDAVAGTDRLAGLLANLLDLSRLQTGAVRPALVAVGVDELVARSVSSADPSLVRDEVPEDLPLVFTDPGLIERSLANVVENALRHSPSGVPVRICAARVSDASGSRVEVRVVDRGPGVEDDDKAEMFAPFQRLGDHGTGQGVGLGLAVARGLADAVGADLAADDTPGGGLTMVLTLPLATTPGGESAT